VQAREFLKGVIVIDEYRGPFYQMVLAMFTLITGGGGGFYVAGKILNVTCAGLSLLVVWKLMRQISDSSIALLVMIFVSLNLNFARYAFTPGTDMLFFLLYVLSIFLLLRCIEDKSAPMQWLFAGLAVAITYLTRYTGISLFVFALIVLIVTMYQKSCFF
jgi:4-amino-4-deoxy-L-arabinose transferase-like glycosyltransferase